MATYAISPCLGQTFPVCRLRRRDGAALLRRENWDSGGSQKLLQGRICIFESLVRIKVFAFTWGQVANHEGPAYAIYFLLSMFSIPIWRMQEPTSSTTLSMFHHPGFPHLKSEEQMMVNISFLRFRRQDIEVAYVRLHKKTHDCDVCKG